MTDNNYRYRNQKVFNDIEAILEKVMHGDVTVDFTLHNKRIVKVKIQGMKTNKYSKSMNGSLDKQNEQACQDIVSRIGTSIDRRESVQLLFQVQLQDGVVQQNQWETKTEIQYDK